MSLAIGRSPLATMTRRHCRLLAAYRRWHSSARDPVAAQEASPAEAGTASPITDASGTPDGPGGAGVFLLLARPAGIASTSSPRSCPASSPTTVAIRHSPSTTVLPEEPAFYLMSNGQLQLLMVDLVDRGCAMFEADSVRLGWTGRCAAPRHRGRLPRWLGRHPRSVPGHRREGLAGGWHRLAGGPRPRCGHRALHRRRLSALIAASRRGCGRRGAPPQPWRC